jgi:hypothetical protein
MSPTVIVQAAAIKAIWICAFTKALPPQARPSLLGIRSRPRQGLLASGTLDL